MRLRDVKKNLAQALEENAERIFLSDEYNQILTGTMYALLKETEYYNVGLKLFPNFYQTAYTDGYTIYVSIDGPFTEPVNTNEEKYLSHIGLLFHECGHLLFTNFKELNDLREEFRQFVFLTDEEIQKIPASYKDVYRKEIDDMVNVIEDMYIENCLKMEYSGQVVKALEQNRNTERKISPSKDELEKLRKDGKLKVIHGFTSILHDYCNVHNYDENEDWVELKKAKEVFDKVKPTVDKLKNYMDINEKKKLLTSIAREMLQLVEDLDDDSTSSPDNAKEQRACENRKSGGLDNLNSKGRKPETKEQKQAKESQKSRQEQIEDIKDSQKLQETFDNLVKDMADSIVKTSNGNEEVDKALNQIYQETDQKFHVIKPDKSSNPKEKYKEIKNSVNPIIKQATNLVKNVLKTKEEPDVETKLTSGGKVVVKDMWKNDGKFFSQQREGDEVPDVAFGLVIDGSGSMNGKKMNSAIKAAVALKEMCNNLNIPCAIISHTGLRIIRFATFADDNDFKYIAFHRGYDGTCDSMGLYVMGEMLEQRPEKEKVMIIISDGEPNTAVFTHKDTIKKTKYLDKNPIDETITVKKAFEKCGVKTYGVALYCYDDIKEIYGKDTIECKDLNELPRKLAKILKQTIFK